MSKFKVGDKVRIVNKDADWDTLNGYELGQEVFIRDLHNGGLHPVTIGNTKAFGYGALELEDIELVKEETMSTKVETKVDRKYKVGDKVRIIRLVPADAGADYKVGDIGKVMYVSGGDLPYIKIDGTSDSVAMFDYQIELVKKSKPKTELRIVYKVAIPSDPSETVFDSYSGRSAITLQYIINKKTKTPKGWNPLFAFDTRENAKRVNEINVLKCVAKVRVDDTDFSFVGDLHVPAGTILCDWVFPLEKV